MEDSKSDTLKTLTGSFQEKNKALAHRIKNLELYKDLCEQRILELHPGHPLPVQSCHLGLGSSSLSVALFNSKQKVAKLEFQLSQALPSPDFQPVSYTQVQRLYAILLGKFEDLKKEKNEIEESLRNEMAATEGLQAYIEVLKQALENNRGAVKGLGSPKEFFLSPRIEKAFPSSTIEKPFLSPTIEKPFPSPTIEKPFPSPRTQQVDSQLNSLTETLNLKLSEIELVSNERDTFAEQLHQAAEALQLAEEEVMKLEEEKNNLINYVETQEKIENELKKDYLEAKGKLEKLEDENKSLEDRVKSLEQEKKNIEEENLEKNREKYSSLEAEKEELKKKTENEKAEFERFKSKSGTREKELEDDKKRLQEKIEEVERSLSDALSCLESERKQTKALSDKEEGNEKVISELKNSLETLDKEKNGLINNTVIGLQENIESLKKNLESTQESHKIHIDSLQINNQNLIEKLGSVTESLSSATQSLESHQNENEELKNSLKISKEILEFSLNKIQSAKPYLNRAGPSELKKKTGVTDTVKEADLVISIESLISALAESDEKQKEISDQLLLSKFRHETVSKEKQKLEIEYSSLAQKCYSQRSQIQDSVKEHILTRESFSRQISLLQHEILTLQKTVTVLEEELEQTMEKNKIISNELSAARSLLVSQGQDLTISDKKQRLLVAEKEYLERVLKRSI